MHRTIESAFAAQYVEDRIRQADAARQTHAARRPRPAGTRARRRFLRSRAPVATPRALRPGR